MMNVNEYIQLILKKKAWTLDKFANEINNVKKQIGIDGKTTKQNISNFLKQADDKHILRPKQLCLWERALGLAPYTLINMVEPIATKEGQKELKEIIKKVRNLN